jgi:hypothetical protein
MKKCSGKSGMKSEKNKDSMKMGAKEGKMEKAALKKKK